MNNLIFFLIAYAVQLIIVALVLLKDGMEYDIEDKVFGSKKECLLAIIPLPCWLAILVGVAFYSIFKSFRDLPFEKQKN